MIEVVYEQKMHRKGIRGRLVRVNGRLVAQVMRPGSDWCAASAKQKVELHRNRRIRSTGDADIVGSVGSHGTRKLSVRTWYLLAISVMFIALFSVVAAILLGADPALLWIGRVLCPVLLATGIFGLDRCDAGAS